MIKNKKSLESSIDLLNGFNQTLKTLLDSGKKDSALIKMQIDSTKSFINKLSSQIAEFENLQKDIVKIESKELTRFSDILIMARIAKGLTQKQLADKLEMAEQQIQRYESSDYSGATFGKMVDVALALELDLKFESFTIVKSKSGSNFSSSEFDKNQTKRNNRKKQQSSIH